MSWIYSLLGLIIVIAGFGMVVWVFRFAKKTLKTREKNNRELDTVIDDGKLVITAIRYALLIMLVLSSLMSSTLLTGVKGSGSDITYAYSTDILNNIDSGYTYDNFNFQNVSVFTDIYNATESFNDESQGDNPAGWVLDESASNFEIEVYGYAFGHNNCLSIDDQTGTAGGWARLNDVITESYGFISFWWYIYDATESFQLRLYGTDLVAHIIEESDHWYYNDGSNHLLGVPDPIDNEWYYVEILYESTAGGYEGLAQYDYRVIINGYASSDIDMVHNYVPEDIFFFTGSSTTTHCLFDAILFDGDTDFVEYDNVYPVNNEIDSLEPDKFQFAFSPTGNLLATGSYSTIEGWTLTDEDLKEDDEGNYLREIEFSAYNGGTESIYRDFDSESYYFHVIFCFDDFGTSLGGTGNNYIQIYKDAGSTLLVDGYFRGYDYYQKIGGSYVNIFDFDYNDGITDEHILDFEISNSYVNLSYYFNGILTEQHAFQGLAVNDGVNRVKYSLVEDGGGGGTIYTDLNYIGVYDNTSSLSDSFGSLIYEDFDNSTWNQEEHYMFDVELEGNCSIAISGSCYNPPSNSYSENIADFDFYNGSYSYNLVDIAIPNGNELTDYYLTFVSNSSLEVSNFSLYGILADSGSDYAYLDFSYYGANLTISYFYVQDEKLYFSMTTESDGAEYIVGTFDFQNYLCANRSFRFIGYRSIGIEAFGYSDYTDATSSTYEILPKQNSFNLIMPQEKEVSQFRVVITDVDDLTYNTTTTGYFTSFTLVYYTDLGLEIIFTNFSTAMIPLMLIFGLALMLAGVYKQNILIPILVVVLSFLCWMTSLIPLWLLFIMIVTGTGFLVITWQRRE